MSEKNNERKTWGRKQFKHWSPLHHWLPQTLWLTKIHVWTLLRTHLRHRLWKKAKRSSFSLEKDGFYDLLKQNNILHQPVPQPIGLTRKIMTSVQFLKVHWGDINISSCKSNCFFWIRWWQKYNFAATLLRPICSLKKYTENPSSAL